MNIKANGCYHKKHRFTQDPTLLDLIGLPQRHRGPRTANRHLPKPREALWHDGRHLCLQVLDSHIVKGTSKYNFEAAPALPAHHDRERVSDKIPYITLAVYGFFLDSRFSRMPAPEPLPLPLHFLCSIM